jgi:ABC-type multidrug transport system ATPase subunit
LNGINLEVPHGRIVGLIGQNGAGKSTLVRLLSGIMKPTSGTAILNGYDLLNNTENVKRITGLLPEEYALYEKLSIWEYVEFIGTLYDMPIEIIEKRFTELAEELEILELRNRLIETLSKGQKQKVALITSLIHEPKILFLDEPLANLDVKAQRTVRNIIKSYKQQDRIILIATHLLSNVQQTCDDIVVIDHGQIEFSGSIQEFKSEYDNLEEAYMNFISEKERT